MLHQIWKMRSLDMSDKKNSKLVLIMLVYLLGIFMGPSIQVLSPPPGKSSKTALASTAKMGFG